MKATRQIQIAGYVSALLFFFHIPFYWLFDWKNSLACLSRDNWLIFHCFNVISIFLLLLMSVASIFHAEEMLRTKVGRLLAMYIFGFYVFRIVAEFVLKGWNEVELVIVAICAIPVIMVGLALRTAYSLSFWKANA